VGVTRLTGLGLGIAILGGIFAGANWPRTEISLLGDVEQVGNHAAFVVGSLGAKHRSK